VCWSGGECDDDNGEEEAPFDRYAYFDEGQASFYEFFQIDSYFGDYGACGETAASSRSAFGTGGAADTIPLSRTLYGELVCGQFDTG
jgi:hypothetical protein